MQLLGNIKEIKGRLNSAPSKDVLQTTRNWFTDRYESAQVQRNFLLLLTLVLVVVTAVLSATISFIKSSSTIEPFVIEIEPKTGVPTYVDFQSSELYTANEAVQRFHVWNYITSREEYYFSTYNKMRSVVQVMSDDSVTSQYNAAVSSRNPQSPFSLLGDNGTVNAELKTLLIEPSGNDFVAQARLRLRISYLNSPGGSTKDKYVRMEFGFRSLEMNKEQRLLNPLGFYVTQYRITDDEVK
jgi:type IV secretion system protein VirB8